MTRIMGHGRAGLRSVLAAGVLLAGFGAASLADEVSSHGEQTPPEIPADAVFTDYDAQVFTSDPVYEDEGYDAAAQVEIYGGKTAIEGAPRPLIELGTPFYDVGPLGEDYALMGDLNLMRPGFRVYGDWRVGVAYNDNGANNEKALVATRLNLEMDLAITATERFHALFRPFDKDNQFTRYEFAGPDSADGFVNEINGQPVTLFFEGDIGAMMAGMTGEYQSFDLPVAAGLIPLITQNGIWLDDAFVGGAFSIVAQNSPSLDISNYDITVFGGFDDVTTQVIKNAEGGQADEDLAIVGIAGFFDANEGYWEAGYGSIIGYDTLRDQGYDNLTLAFTRRYGSWLSNSVRGFYTFGEDLPNGAPSTAGGYAILVENSLVTSMPLTLVPYFNAWVGVDQPQPLAKQVGGLLTNTGINFATDNLTGFPTLDSSANDTFGGALGVEYLFNLDKQIVFEVAGLRAFGDSTNRIAPGDEAAVGISYQQPLSLEWIVATQAMYGWIQDSDDIGGVRFELRRKF